MLNFDPDNPLTKKIISACQRVPTPDCIGVICHRAGTGALATEAIVAGLINQGVIIKHNGKYEALATLTPVENKSK